MSATTDMVVLSDRKRSAKNELANIAALEEFNTENKGRKFDLNGLKCFAKCVKVYDGDTCTLTFPWGGEYYFTSVRCYGYNTAEIRSKDALEKLKGIEARDRVRELILNSPVWVEFYLNDKYGRPLANIHIIEVKKNKLTRKSRVLIKSSLKDILISEGLAAEYYGRGEKAF